MEYVKRIAQVTQEDRKNAILSILDELGIRYTRQKAVLGKHAPENIIVSYNPSPSRLVIGAHWDSVEGSTGANDNAAACSILIRLAALLTNTKHSIDLVFFDREEYEDHGSTTYLTYTGKDRISAMINLDMCGHGENIIVSDKGNTGNALFMRVMDDSILKKYNVHTVAYLPNGDDQRFSQAGIPNISVCVLNNRDLVFFQYISQKINAGQPLTEEDQTRFLALDVIATMHLGAKDHIGAVSQPSMDMLVQYLYDGLR
ncbi:MAG TPA: M28 family peptidase [Candidatus Scatavimonas merdigallinarum]|uniref:M28 family peptidase n=1 Tax=Candidatus Scatavimonas merdigallinarum TaxID=2840914 RepID=A0A9D1CTY7_9FIRM|nr:M28 family peptidase [Candidatus Scatavimonas merdigallinarum]